MNRINQSLIRAETIRNIQLFYYSSQNHIFINTCLIELISEFNQPNNIKVTKTQINQPFHHVYGQAPFLTVNSSNVVKKSQLWQFIALIVGIDPKSKYQFLSVANLTQQISQVSNLFTQYDRNPYFIFLSPWRKYKKHCELQNQRIWFRQNTHYFNLHEDTLNKEYFLYRINSLATLISQYKVQRALRVEYLFVYEMFIYAMIKHVKSVSPTFYKITQQIQVFKTIQSQIQQKITQQHQRKDQQRPIARNILFTNVNVNKFKEIEQERIQQKYQVDAQRQKLYQNLFKPFLATTVFGLVLWAFH